MPLYLFIVSRQHIDLYQYLTERFRDDANVRVVLDRRRGERRSRDEQRVPDRRRGERRTRPEIDEDLRSRSHAIVTVQ